MGYADLAAGQSWRDAQNKMNVVLVCSRSVEADFLTLPQYMNVGTGLGGGVVGEDREGREGKGRRTPPPPFL